MNFKELAGNIAKGTAVAAVTTVRLAGMGIYEGGKLAKKGIGSAYDTVKEDRQLMVEINDIDKCCADVVEDIKHNQTKCEDDFNNEVNRYNAIVEKVNTQMHTCNVILSYMEMNRNENRLRFTSQHEGDIDVQVNYLGKSGSVLAAGGAAGVAAGGAAVGIVTAFGTASTGTALASLSGAAYTHALLSTLGMGSLASGGFGMTGGMVVLGATFLAPAAAVAGYMANKEIKKAHAEALKRAKKAVEIANETKLVFEKYEKGINNYRRLNYSCEEFSHHFGEIINMFQAVEFTENDRAAYQKVLESTAAAMNEYGSIELIDADGEVNLEVDHELNQAGKKAEEAKYQFYTYMQNLSHEKQRVMDDAKDVELLVKDRDDLKRIIEQKDKTILKKDKEIHRKDKFIEKLQVKINSLNNETLSLKQKIESIEDDEERASILFEGLQKEQEQIVANDKNRFKICYKDIAERYKHLDDDAIRYIATGETLYSLYPNIAVDGIDFSPVVLDYAKCIENVTKRLLVKKGVFDKYDPKLNKLCLGSAKKKLEDNCKSKSLNQEFFNVLSEIIDYRNKSAHPNQVYKCDADRVRILVLGKFSGKFTEGILLYFDSLLTEKNRIMIR